MYVSDVRLFLRNLRSRCNLVILFFKRSFASLPEESAFWNDLYQIWKTKMHSTPIERH